MNQQQAIDLRAEAEAIYRIEDYDLGQAIQALNLIHEATAIERALGLPPQTKTITLYTPPEKSPDSTVTDEQREACVRLAEQYRAREDQKTRNRQEASARYRQQSEPPREGFKQLPTQLSFL